MMDAEIEALAVKLLEASRARGLKLGTAESCTGGMIAGALKMPLYKFLFWCALGKIIKMLIIAFAGSYSIDWLQQFFH